ncbi:MAG: hypothetical protein U9O20_04010 [Patescibacteria group bacterium]|nr:hypothetical protein [Patescibacteria group bacterium]
MPTDDIKRAGDFYSKSSWWKIQDISVKDMKYYMAYTAGAGDDYISREVRAVSGGLYERRDGE